MRARPSLRRLFSLGHLFVAFALLVGVFFVARAGITDATEHADAKVEARRMELAKSYAELIAPTITAGRNEVSEVARRVASAPTPAAGVEAYTSAPKDPPALFDEVLVLTAAGDRIVTASQGPALGIKELRECAGDTRLRELVRATTGDARPVRVVTVPWDCGVPRVATGEPVGGNVAVVLKPYADVVAPLGAGRIGTVSVEVVDPAFFDDADDSPRTAFLEAHRGDPVVLERYGGVVGAYADAGSGWGVTVEQPEGDFDGDGRPDKPVVVGLTAIAAALAVAFVLLTFFDLRRRRVYSRTEEAKHAFFATVGHELRTPLTVLKGYSDTLTARWDSLSDDAKEMLVSNMAPAAQRLASLVEKLILASNIQAEAYVKPVARPTPVADVLQTVAARFRPLAPLHTFVVDVDPLLPEALADGDALEQVLQQLLDNAVKYSPSGGRVTISAMRAKRGIEIAVSDEGVGLPQNVEEIFEPLVQGEAVDTRVHDEGGAGVGLFIVRTLVRDMRGTVRAERRTPTGSRFVVTLRAAKTKAAARAVARV